MIYQKNLNDDDDNGDDDNKGNNSAKYFIRTRSSRREDLIGIWCGCLCGCGCVRACVCARVCVFGGWNGFRFCPFYVLDND